MKRSKKIEIISLLIAVIVLATFPNTAFANSALRVIEGRNSSGAIVKVSNSAINVEKEILTFDIQDFPQTYYASEEEFSQYSSKVSAEYHFYNNSEATVYSTLLFPFGKEPSFYINSVEDYFIDNLDNYDVLINGERIEKTLRHTYLPHYNQFNLKRDLPRVVDDYKKDSFFKFDLKITKYSISTSEISTKDGKELKEPKAACLAIDWESAKNKNRKIWMPSLNSMSWQDGEIVRMGTWIGHLGDSIEIYVFGEPFESMPKFTFYKNGGLEDGTELKGETFVKYVEELTFEDFIFQHYNESKGVSKVDWYNACLDAIYENKYSDSVLELSCLNELFYMDLMRWYEYDIKIEPKGRIINTVVAPMYPLIDMSWEPPIYQYTYLLTPASTFGSFKNLEVYINTPYYLYGSIFDLDNFEKTEKGYRILMDELPGQDLFFTLCSVENPERVRNPYGWGDLIGIVISVFVIAGIVSVLGGVGLAIYYFIKNKKQKKENEKQES
ncbi:MAG: hypothetical protein IKA39_01640 [Clostridia bacterium]|nr:hypothetical protein [Clostridia bacterium]